MTNETEYVSVYKQTDKDWGGIRTFQAHDGGKYSKIFRLVRVIFTKVICVPNDTWRVGVWPADCNLSEDDFGGGLEYDTPDRQEAMKIFVDLIASESVSRDSLVPPMGKFIDAVDIRAIENEMEYKTVFP